MANIRSSSLSPAGFVMTREAVSVCMCSVASVYTCTRLPMGAELVRHSLSIVFSLSLRLPASRSLAHISPFYILMKFKMIMKKTRAHTHTHTHTPSSEIFSQSCPICLLSVSTFQVKKNIYTKGGWISSRRRSQERERDRREKTKSVDWTFVSPHVLFMLSVAAQTQLSTDKRRLFSL